MGPQEVHKLPVVDLTKKDLKPGTASWMSACNDVRCALEEYGCFVAIYDEVSSELHDQISGAIATLFDLPLETKKQNVSDKPYFGYIGQIPQLPRFEAMGIDHPTTLEGIKNFTHLMWPNGNDHFGESVHSFAKKVVGLNEMVVRMVLESYGLEKYNSIDQVTTYLLRVMRYLAPKIDDPKLGSPPHTDKSFSTILHQNDVNGLEIQAKDGEWIQVELSTSSFFFMAGDTFMAWSNDRIHSANHRVMMSGNETRYSQGLFSFLSGLIQPPEELVDEEHPLRYKPFDNIGLIRFFYTDEGRKAECLVKAYCGI